MSTTQPGPWRFLSKAMLFWLPVWLGLASLEAVLVRGGETVPVDDVLDAQEADPDLLFLRQFLDQEFQHYKTAALLRTTPAVAVLGSSRVMKIRSFFFENEDAFYNAGGVLQRAGDVADLAEILRARDAVPSLVLVGYDIWWFSSGYRAGAAPLADAVRRDAARSWSVHWRAMRALALTLLRNPGRVAATVRAADPQRGFGFPTATGNGFRADGSIARQSFDEAVARKGFVDRERPPILQRLREGLVQFAPPVELAPARLEAFIAGVRALRDAGAEVVVFSTPFCSEVADAMRDDPAWRDLGSRVRTDLRAKLLPLGVLVRDFPDPASLGLTDRHMIDCIHGVEVMSAAVLERLASAPEAPPLLRRSQPRLERLLADEDRLWTFDPAALR